MWADFHWLRPEWLWALPVIGALDVCAGSQAPRAGKLAVGCRPGARAYVLSRSQIKGLGYRWWLILFGGTIAALSLAGPSWNRVEQPVFRSDQAMVVALDLSRSMDAQDLAPSRLARARLEDSRHSRTP